MTLNYQLSTFLWNLKNIQNSGFCKTGCGMDRWGERLGCLIHKVRIK